MLLIQSKKLTITQKLVKLKIKQHDHDKYLTIQGFNKLAAETFTERLVQANLGSNSNIANFVKKTDLNKNALNEL